MTDDDGIFVPLPDGFRPTLLELDTDGQWKSHPVPRWAGERARWFAYAGLHVGVYDKNHILVWSSQGGTRSTYYRRRVRVWVKNRFSAQS